MEAKDFKVGMRVRWATNPADKGTVVEVGYCRVKVKWDLDEWEEKNDPEGRYGVYGETGFPLIPIKSH
jgi:hypothetical protein